MFNKILIANRGEIACRIIRTCQRLGVATVAVYSDADAHSMHVASADEAIHIGGAAVADSYLRGEKIIEAALATGAQAIHPGYGFLSENPDFVAQVTAAGLRFIGPSADSIRAMGLKDAAKALMHNAGVPVVPGYHGDNQDPEFLATQADEIGYPVLIKARAGGGGKGMRKVEAATEFTSALQGAQREAQASFGDDRCLIEKYINTPRHIEIQVFGDDHGNVVHLFERDCSLQRRHQKVIEEAPAPGMTDEMRHAMGEAAIKACQAINYSGAGTIEFIVDSSNGLKPDAFWFMEMNTRLQVEHPVTEAITGQDLVEWQLRVAAGEPLPVAQSQLSINGWAFEARVYAEDVEAGFLPATGTMSHLKFPSAARIDTGIRQGDTITPYYDPMISKVIVHAHTREQALNGLQQALLNTQAAGSVTNIRFLAALCTHPDFASGIVDTGLIERDLSALTESIEPPQSVTAIAAIAALGLTGNTSPFSGFTLWQPLSRMVSLKRTDSEVFDPTGVTVETLAPDRFAVSVGDDSLDVVRSGDQYRINGSAFAASVFVDQQQVTVFSNGTFSFEFPDALAAADNDGAGGDQIVAPMPGLIKVVSVKAGDTVTQGEALLVLEAMKMEHTLTAPRDGVISDVPGVEEAQVEAGTVLVRLETEEQ